MSHNNELVTYAASFGLGENVVQTLVREVGPLLAKALLQWIASKASAEPNFLSGAVAAHCGSPYAPGVKLDMNGSLARQFLVGLLRGHRDEVVAFVTAGLGEVFDKVVDLLDDHAG